MARDHLRCFPIDCSSWLHRARLWLGTLLFFALAAFTAVAHAATYSALADFRDVQGYNGWRYLDTLGQEMIWDAGLPGWRCINAVGYGCFIRPQDLDPGADRDIIRRWVAPSGGTAHIIGKVYKVVIGGDGVYALIRKTTASGAVTTLWERSIPYGDRNPNDANSTFDLYGIQIAPGDMIDFVLLRQGNNLSDQSYFLPTIQLETADTIYDLAALSGPNGDHPSTNLSVAFNGLNFCANGAYCRYTTAYPPDYYTVEEVFPPGTLCVGPCSFPAPQKLDNYPGCGPGDRLCFRRFPPFVAEYPGLTPATTHKYLVKAYRQGDVYGIPKTVTLSTQSAPPPPVHVGVSMQTDRRAAISFWPDTDGTSQRQYLEKYVLYRQRVGTETKLVPTAGGPVSGRTGHWFCQNSPGVDKNWACTEVDKGGACEADLIGGLTVTCGKFDSPERLGETKWVDDHLSWIANTNEAGPMTTMCADQVVCDPPADRKPTAYRYTLVARWNPRYVTPALSSAVSAPALLRRPSPVVGFADTHNHQFGNLSHGGKVLAGRSGDNDDGSATFDGNPYFVPGNVFNTSGGFWGNATSSALKDCGSWGTGTHNLGILNLFVQHQYHGYPDFAGWPTYQSDFHQQVYKTALQRAWRGGLRLMVMHAVNSEFLCKVVASVAVPPGSSPLDCRDSLSASDQLTAAYRFQDEIDAEAGCTATGAPDTNLTNACGWYRIVTTPETARATIAAGKLAVVLGVEVDTAFGCGTGTVGAWGGGSPGAWSAVPGTRTSCSLTGPGSISDGATIGSLAWYKNRGVRHIFPVHLIDNGIGRAAAFSGLFNVEQERVNGNYYNVEVCPNRSGDTTPYSFIVDNGPSFGGLTLANVLVGSPALPAGYASGMTSTCNRGSASPSPPVGLTATGIAVVTEMMKQRMIIDIDHMSNRTHIDTVALSKTFRDYPLISGHTGLAALAKTGEGQHEGALSDVELNEVRASGGQVSLNLAQQQKTTDIAAYMPASGTAVAHDCDGSSKSFAQQYLVTVDKTRLAPLPMDGTPQASAVKAVGFGSDFNTLKRMIQPRFGPDGCNENSAQRANQDPGSAIQYDVNLDGPGTITPGLGGIATSLPGDPSQNFAGFTGPVLPRSRINEGGFTFRILSPDTPQSNLNRSECLDAHGGAVNTSAEIQDCGDGTWRNQQFRLNANGTLTPWVLGTTTCLQGPTNVVTGGTASFQECNAADPRQMWSLTTSGRVMNQGLCLGTSGQSLGSGTAVVVTACVSAPANITQFWAKGSWFESYNLTGLSHVGMYPDFIEDLKRVGVSDAYLVPLYQSAEGYIQMWERTAWTRPVDYTKISSDATWRWSSTPAAGWQDIDFDDTTWNTVNEPANGGGPGDMGAFGVPPWFTNVGAGLTLPSPAHWIWSYNASNDWAAGASTVSFRKAFEADGARATSGLVITVTADNEWKVFFDGALLTSSPINPPNPENNWGNAAVYLVAPAIGTHVIAIKAINTGGPAGLFVDVR